MALFGSRATLRDQTADRPEAFAAAFSYLEEVFRPGSPAAARLAALAAGETKRVELSDGAFALEQAYWTKAREDGFFESHRRYIDVQVVVAGHEAMEVVDLSRVEQTAPYDAERDFIKHGEQVQASRLMLGEGEAAVFFPADVHMPSLRSGADPQLVRKSVVKVPVIA
ncbi:YhcH/YjgK/YiaL family protein [Horticoccus luteus]|uniref:YhcH/YjgK/YiaL family protein n=1 Tax=Horticoccus luteus TaxID=2862869 RepID=A0A8F9TY90_9BACT|nr:YhcH/YjgK/YiaL family protein [Horticoccus luteus]QYM79953.1 YhcH/YjgK/YiaL family protein [Horticoccus luteus]